MVMPTPCNGVGTACSVPTHDHTTTVDRDGLTVPAQPMTCNHCGVPAHYNSEVDDYFHDATPSCWLSYGPECTDSPSIAADADHPPCPYCGRHHTEGA